MPMMPSRLPQMRWPSIQVGDQPVQCLLAVLEQRRALGQPARHRQDQGHGHVGRVLGQHARRVGDDDAAHARGVEVDVVDAVAEVGDQFQLRPGLGQQGAVEPVGHRRHQDVRRLHGLAELVAAHRLVLDVEARVEQLAHARFHRLGQLARHDDERLFGGCRHGSSELFVGWPASRAARSLKGVMPCLTDGRCDDKTLLRASPVARVDEPTAAPCGGLDLFGQIMVWARA